MPGAMSTRWAGPPVSRAPPLLPAPNAGGGVLVRSLHSCALSQPAFLIGQRPGIAQPAAKRTPTLPHSQGAKFLAPPSKGLTEELWEPGDSEFGPPGGVTFINYLKYCVLAALFTVGAYLFHPQLWAFWTGIEETYLTGDLLVSGSRLFSFISLVFSILVGSTFRHQYMRQQTCLALLYSEVLALENFWLNAKAKAPEIMKGVAKHVRTYIDSELTGAVKGSNSPFRPGAPVAGLMALLSTLPQASTAELKRDLGAVTAAHTRRAAAFVMVLPIMHWIMMWGLVFVFLTSYLVFETNEAPVAGLISFQRLIFSLLTGLSSSIVLIVQDLSKNLEGTYSLVRPLGQRLKYLRDEVLGY